MSALRNNSFGLARLGALLSLAWLSTPAAGEIILLDEGWQPASTRMRSIVLVAPTASLNPTISRNLQRSHAWASYRHGDSFSGWSLTATPHYGASTGHHTSVSNNLSRAHAFRLDYYK